jgi:hypothetical protein
MQTELTYRVMSIDDIDNLDAKEGYETGFLQKQDAEN